MSKNRVKFTTNLDEDLLKEIKIAAIKDGVDVNDILEGLIIEYLKKEKH